MLVGLLKPTSSMGRPLARPLRARSAPPAVRLVCAVLVPRLQPWGKQGLIHTEKGNREVRGTSVLPLLTISAVLLVSLLAACGAQQEPAGRDP